MTLILPSNYYLMDDDDDRMIRITTGFGAAAEQPVPNVGDNNSSLHYVSNGCYSVTGEQVIEPAQRPQRCPLDSATFVVPLNSLLRVSPVFAAMFSGQRFAESKSSEIALRGYSPESVAAFCSFISNFSSPTAATNHNRAFDNNVHAGDVMSLGDDAPSASVGNGSFNCDFAASDSSPNEVADFVRDLNVFDLQDLLILSEQYEVQPLKYQIELALASCITVQNAFDMLVLACDARAPYLKRAVEKYAAEHFSDLCALGKWNEFRLVSQRTRNQAVEGEMTQRLIDELSKQFQSL